MLEGFIYARNTEELTYKENIGTTETVYRAVGQTSTIHSLFAKEALHKSVYNVDVICLFSEDPYSFYRPVEIHLSDANQQSLLKVLEKTSIYIQLSYRHCHASAVPVHIVLISINTPQSEASGNHAAFFINKEQKYS